MSGWLRRRWYDVGWSVSALTMIFGFSMRAKGRHHLPMRGPALIVSNHESHLDPAIIGGAAPRYLAYMARKTLFRHRIFGAMIRNWDAVPIDQEGSPRAGLEAVLIALSQGKAVVMFPEGHRTPDGNMLPLLPGVLLIIRKAKVPIIPAGVAGSFEAWPRQQKLPKLAPIFCPANERNIGVAFRPAIPPERFEGLGRDETLALLEQEIRLAMADAESVRRKI